MKVTDDKGIWKKYIYLLFFIRYKAPIDLRLTNVLFCVFKLYIDKQKFILSQSAPMRCLQLQHRLPAIVGEHRFNRQPGQASGSH